MKNFNLKSILSIIIISLFISVMFVYADWTPPPAGAPTCPASEPGCNAPLNVGSGAQLKTGSLSVNGILQSMSALCIGDDCRTSWPSEDGNHGQENCYWTGYAEAPRTCASGYYMAGTYDNNVNYGHNIYCCQF